MRGRIGWHRRMGGRTLTNDQYLELVQRLEPHANLINQDIRPDPHAARDEANGRRATTAFEKLRVAAVKKRDDVVDRKARISKIAELIAAARWHGRSNQWIANRLATVFLDVQFNTLRLDVAAAKK